jgi:MFS family permease
MLRDVFAALSIRHFAVLWAGSLTSFTAFFMSTVVQSIVAFELTGRNSAVGVVLLGQGISSLLLGPLGGAYADRVSKKAVSLACQSVITLVFFGTGLLIALDRVELYHLFLGSLIVGAMFAFMGPARQAWVVELVGEDLRANAVALNQVALNASRVVAPGIAGLMVAVAIIGAEGAYFTMGVLYLGVVVSVMTLPPSRPSDASTRARSVFGDMVAGWRYVIGQPRLRTMILLFYAMITLGLSSTTAFPGLVENELGRSVEDIGVMSSVSAVGGLMASLLVAPIAGSRRALPVYAAGGVLTGLSLVLTGVTPTFLLVFGPMFLMGLGTGAFQTLNSAVIVTESEPQYYGRVISLTSMAFGAFMLASLPVGLAADAVGERATLVGIGVLIVVCVAILAPMIARAAPAAPLVRTEAAPAAGGDAS